MGNPQLNMADKVPAWLAILAALAPAFVVSLVVGCLGFGFVVAVALGCGTSLITVGKKWWAIGTNAFDPKLTWLLFGVPAVCLGWNIGIQFASAT